MSEPTTSAEVKGYPPHDRLARPLIPAGSAFRRVVVILLLLLGITCWLGFGTGNRLDLRSLEVAGAVFLLLLVPPVRRWMTVALDRLRTPSAPAATWTAVGVWIGAALLLFAFAAGEGRTFVPTYHDEHANLIQMQMLAQGRLWMPRHPMADFFETFHVFVNPVYASMYCPGASLLYVPTAWLHVPYWFMSLLVSGAVVGMTYRVLTELVDGIAGFLGALLLLSSRPFRLASIMILSHPIAWLWSLLAVWVWMCWRRRQEHGLALLLGVLFGWAAITRPLDALCFAAPVTVGVLLDLRGKTAARWCSVLGLVTAGAIPFVVIQLVADYGITGHVLDTPYQRYLTQYFPGLTLGFAPFNRQWTPQTDLLQKRVYYETFIVPMLETHTIPSILSGLYNFRLPLVFQANLPATILLILLPAGILGLTDLERRVAWSILPLFVAAYATFPAFLPHYTLAVSLPIALMLSLGVRAVTETWPRPKRTIDVFLTMMVVSFAASAMPGIKPDAFDQDGRWPVMTAVHERLPHMVQAPAVVLFPFRRSDNPHEEPVYNVDVAWPDDAPIIHAQHLGLERDREIAAYYAKTQPDRNFYVFDRRDYSVHSFGKAKDFLAYLTTRLAGGADPHPPTRAPAP
jgi:hypothetical protein